MPQPRTLPDAATPASPRAIPKPGQLFDPVARALDLVGDRWTLVLVRHLLSGPKGFQELRQRTGIAPRVLSRRLQQLVSQGWVSRAQNGTRSPYAVTERGRTLEPIIAAAARWWVHHAMDDRADTSRFTATAAQSILESLPFLLREDRAAGVSLCFEIRLSGEGGGVWTVRIDDAQCRVERGFAEGADVRYTAPAKVWCAMAVGRLDARRAIDEGRLVKEGGRAALDDFFHQIPRASS